MWVRARSYSTVLAGCGSPTSGFASTGKTRTPGMLVNVDHHRLPPAAITASHDQSAYLSLVCRMCARNVSAIANCGGRTRLQHAGYSIPARIGVTRRRGADRGSAGATLLASLP